jgi:hypothetical protein
MSNRFFAGLLITIAVLVVKNGRAIEAIAEAKPDQALSPEQVQKIQQAIKELASDDFQTRETATKALLKMPSAAIEPLTRQEAASNDAEVKLRIKKIVSELRFAIEENVTDADRAAAKETIDAYESKLSILQTIKVGERLQGTLMVRNSGEKRIKVLELTLVVSVNGKEKPEEHRLVFVKNGHNAPPQPSRKGADGAALMRVDFPCPADGVKGAPELKLTYLKFEE